MGRILVVFLASLPGAAVLLNGIHFVRERSYGYAPMVYFGAILMISGILAVIWMLAQQKETMLKEHRLLLKEIREFNLKDNEIIKDLIHYRIIDESNPFRLLKHLRDLRKQSKPEQTR